MVPNLDVSQADMLSWGAATLGSKRTLLHSNHGVIICAETMYLAFDYLYYLERAAEVTVKARSTGMPLRQLSDEVHLAFLKQICFLKQIW